MTEQKPHVGVGIIVYNPQGELLLGLRRGEHESTVWGLPGGALEMGETLFACARREVLEETGLSIENLELVSISDDLPGPQAPNHFVSIGVRATSSGEPTVREPEKCREWRWFPPEKIPDSLFRPSKKILNHVKYNTCYNEDSSFAI